jgi:hypothetical protein
VTAPAIDRQKAEINWLRFVEFAEQAIRISADTGTELDKFPLSRMPGGLCKVPEPKKLADFSDLEFFTVAPVSQHCAVPFDIFGEFRAHMETRRTKYSGPRCMFNFKHPIVSGACGHVAAEPWSYCLEAMAASEFSAFKSFMTSQTIRRAESREYWEIYHDCVVVADPVCIDNKSYDPQDAEKQVIVHCFLPSGNRYIVGVDLLAPRHDTIAMKLEPAHPGVKMTAEAMLRTIG